jgi:hypothetical protein
MAVRIAIEPWPDVRLTVQAVQEIYGLDEHGEVGKAAQAATTADGLIDIWSSLGQAALPLDFAIFNKYHHGIKVRAQDIEVLKGCMQVGGKASR